MIEEEREAGEDFPRGWTDGGEGGEGRRGGGEEDEIRTKESSVKNSRFSRGIGGEKILGRGLWSTE